jgi:hypothetical protein
MLGVSMLQKSYWDTFLGEIFCVCAGTIGDAAGPIISVTTLGSNGALFVVVVRIFHYELVLYVCCMGEVKRGCVKAAGLLFSASLIGKLVSSGDFGF